tara:strand:+ start:421 stop:537 length:117 start_codon:yes stop_codon:yes gene_type:complete
MNNDHKQTVREDIADAASLILMFLIVVFGIPVIFMVFK